MFVDFVNDVSNYAIPVIILVLCTYGIFKKVKVYEVFTEGAKEGFATAIRIIPFLVSMLIAIGVRKTRYAPPSGLFADLTGMLAAVFITNLMF